MAGRRPQPPDSVAVLTVGDSGDPKVDRQFVQIQQAVQDLQVRVRADATAIAALQAAGGGGGGVTDGDKGDVTVSGSGTVWTVDALPESRITGLVADLAGKVPTTRTITAGTGLTGGGDLSADRSIALANTAVTPASYTYGSFTVDAQGRLTAASNGATPALAARVITTTAPLRIDAGASADLSADRTLSVNTFTTGASGVVPAGVSANNVLRGDASWGAVPDAAMPALTGDVTTSAGTVATTIANDAVTNAKLANMANATFKLRVTAGTGDPEDGTVAQALSLLVTSTGLRLWDLGDGSDGNCDFDGTNTFTFASKSGSTYTLTRSVFLNGATIRSGVTIKPDGWIIRSNALIDDQAGSDINVNGNNGSGSTGATQTWTPSSRELPSGVAGANGGNGGAASGTAPQVFSTTAAGGGTGGVGAGATGNPGTGGGIGHGAGGGGAGGTAGGGTGNTGGAGGTVTLFAPSATTGGHVLEYAVASSGRTRAGAQLSHNSGGGGGANGVTASTGGASGSGGGWMVVIAHSITGAGTWRSIGGNGVAGAAGGAGTNGQGGGSGGAGGIIAIRVCIGAHPAAGTSVVVTGASGASGGAGAGGGGAGGTGGKGGDGYYIKL